jgi:Zn-dependent protease with chaperone function
MRRTLRIWAGTVAVLAACMLAPASVMSGIGHPLLGIGLAVAIVLLITLGREIWRHERLAASIARLAHPATMEGHPVALVPGLGAALVAGLRHPRIFCADDLSQRLDADELRAVILHEHHHQLDRGPVRLVLIGALAPVLGHLEAGRAWMERERAHIEIAADAFALESGASRPALASALLKLAPSPSLRVAPGFASAVDLRMRALLGESSGVEHGGSAGQFVAAFVLIASCIGLYFK